MLIDMMNIPLRLAVFLLVATFVGGATGKSHAGDQQPLTVVELYTSQGCSSCPRADAYLGELADRAERERLLPLSFHVDYWDYLGWKDPYSSRKNSDRQRLYAQYMEQRYVYTPQMVIQGTYQVTGSDRASVDHAIMAAGKKKPLDITMRKEGNDIIVSLPGLSTTVNANLFVVLYDDAHTTKIKRGENRGEELENRNVVRYLKKVAHWKGSASEIPFTLPVSKDGRRDGCAVLLQSADTGHILGAQKIQLN